MTPEEYDGMTWEEFKREVERYHVKDTDRIMYIDVDGYLGILRVDFKFSDKIGVMEVEIT
jgi:hypothetical protein